MFLLKNTHFRFICFDVAKIELNQTTVIPFIYGETLGKTYYRERGKHETNLKYFVQFLLVSEQTYLARK